MKRTVLIWIGRFDDLTFNAAGEPTADVKPRRIPRRLGHGREPQLVSRKISSRALRAERNSLRGGGHCSDEMVTVEELPSSDRQVIHQSHYADPWERQGGGGVLGIYNRSVGAVDPAGGHTEGEQPVPT